MGVIHAALASVRTVRSMPHKSTLRLVEKLCDGTSAYSYFATVTDIRNSRWVLCEYSYKKFFACVVGAPVTHDGEVTDLPVIWDVYHYVWTHRNEAVLFCPPNDAIRPTDADWVIDVATPDVTDLRSRFDVLCNDSRLTRVSTTPIICPCD